MKKASKGAMRPVVTSDGYAISIDYTQEPPAPRQRSAHYPAFPKRKILSMLIPALIAAGQQANQIVDKETAKPKEEIKKPPVHSYPEVADKGIFGMVATWFKNVLK